MQCHVVATFAHAHNNFKWHPTPRQVLERLVFRFRSQTSPPRYTIQIRPAGYETIAHPTIGMAATGLLHSVGLAAVNLFLEVEKWYGHGRTGCTCGAGLVCAVASVSGNSWLVHIGLFSWGRILDNWAKYVFCNYSFCVYSTVA